MPSRLNIWIIILLLFCSKYSFGQAEMHTTHKPLPCIDKTFGVYVHFTQDSLGQIDFKLDTLLLAIEEANEAFAPLCIRFNICKMDTIDNWKFNEMGLNYILDEYNSLYHIPYFVNLTLVGSFTNPAIAGNSNFNGISSPSNAYVFVRNDIETFRQKLIHELGHLFGLYDTYRKRDELVNGTNSNTHGDLIVDTPADPFFPNSNNTWTRDCEFVYEGIDSLGYYYIPDVGNNMAVYNCATCGFSYDQFLRMANNWLTSPKLLR